MGLWAETLNDKGYGARFIGVVKAMEQGSKVARAMWQGPWLAREYVQDLWTVWALG